MGTVLRAALAALAATSALGFVGATGATYTISGTPNMCEIPTDDADAGALDGAIPLLSCVEGCDCCRDAGTNYEAYKACLVTLAAGRPAGSP